MSVPFWKMDGLCPVRSVNHWVCSFVFTIPFTAGPVQTGVLYIEGVPEPYGTAYPSYGAHIGIADGLRFMCTAPASYDVGDLTAVCTGWKLFEKQAGEWVEVESGDGTSTVITHNASVDRALRWQYAVRSAAGLADFAVDSVSVGKATFSGRVTGIGQTSDSAEVRIVCGYSADSLFLTNAVADVTGICGWSGSVAGLEPGRSYVAKAVLVNSAGETVESAPVLPSISHPSISPFEI